MIYSSILLVCLTFCAPWYSWCWLWAVSPQKPPVLGVSTLDVCLRCPQEQTQIPLEACLARTVLEERADYSRRGEMTKHDLTPLSVESSPPRTAALTPVNIIRGGKCCNYVRYKREMAIGPVVSLHAGTASRC